MGLFGFGKKVKVSGEIVTDAAKRSASSVYANPGSKVYHYEWGGCGSVASDAKAMTEKHALASGMHRCKKCDWYKFDKDNGNG